MEKVRGSEFRCVFSSSKYSKTRLSPRLPSQLGEGDPIPFTLPPLLQPQLLNNWLSGLTLFFINMKQRLLTISVNTRYRVIFTCLYWKVWEFHVVWKVVTQTNGLSDYQAIGLWLGIWCSLSVWCIVKCNRHKCTYVVYSLNLTLHTGDFLWTGSNCRWLTVRVCFVQLHCSRLSDCGSYLLRLSGDNFVAIFTQFAHKSVHATVATIWLSRFGWDSGYLELP